MHEHFDVAIIGAGPAGVACGTTLSGRGLKVVVLDEQPGPGGQVWRNIEAAGRFGRPEAIWSDYALGREAVDRFRRSDCAYRPNTQVWQIEPGWRLFLNSPGDVGGISASRIILAVGAQERPMPLAGWQLPGVMTVGAAQILLKTSGTLPSGAPYLVGSGPLLLYYASQMLMLGARPAGIIDLRERKSLPVGLLLAAARRNIGALLKGLDWLRLLAMHRIPLIKARAVSALGDNRLEAIEIVERSGRIRRVAAELLLLHDGVVPRTHEGAMAGLPYRWDREQQCLVAAPAQDMRQADAIVVGDAARIGGARAALATGTLAGLALAQAMGRGHPQDRKLQQRMTRQAAGQTDLRAFLDHHYAPGGNGLSLPDNAVVCRCEEVTAGTIRGLARQVSGLDELKARTRIGMGACQGRNCALSAAQLLAAHRGEAVEAPAYRVRPPARSLRIEELSRLPGELPT